MKEWNVYVNGKWVGCVDARNEDDARCAANSQFDIDEGADISVNPR